MLHIVLVPYIPIGYMEISVFVSPCSCMPIYGHLYIYCNSPCPFMPIYGDLLTVSPCPFYAHIWIFLMSSVYEHIWAFWYAHIWRSLNCKPLSLLCPYIDIPDVIRICPYMGFLICPYMEISVSPYMGIKGCFRSDIRFVYIGLLGLTSQTPWAIWPRNLYLGIDDSSWHSVMSYWCGDMSRAKVWRVTCDSGTDGRPVEVLILNCDLTVATIYLYTHWP